MNFIIINLKKYFISTVIIFFTISLALFSTTNLEAAKNGLALFATSVFPTLFPFFVATELLLKTNIISTIGKYLNKYIKPTFNVPGESIFAIILGTISGYPIGAKIVCELKKEKKISRIEAERLIAFTNNSGPLFIIGTVGTALLKNKSLGKILLLSHILASITVGLIFRFWKKNIPDFSTYTLSYPYKNNIENNLIKVSNFGEILGEAIKKSISSLLTIGGFIILFSVIISILEASHFITNFSSIFSVTKLDTTLFNSFLYGIIELTNGINLASTCINTSSTSTILVISFLLGFGGISVLLQIFSIISKENISLKPYFYGKVLQAFISVFYTFILI